MSDGYRLKGRFDCWRAEGPTMAEMLAAAHGGDAVARRAVADWLAEQDDPRAAKAAKAAPKGGEKFWSLFGLTPEHAAYLRLFSLTRRMKRDARQAKALPDPVRLAAGLPIGKDGGNFVGAGGFMGQDRDDSVLEYNKPPAGQPGLWCPWTANDAGTAIVSNGTDEPDRFDDWLKYLLARFLAPWGYTVEGDVEYQDEDGKVLLTLRVRANKLTF